MNDITACIIIPCYNHARQLMTIMDAVISSQTPVIVVDDGSGAVDKEVLRSIAQKHPEIEVMYFDRNYGKGAAVTAGLQRAGKRGFSHALQIDADGQHDARDIYKFLSLSRTSPLSVICGQAIYDGSVPALRKYARYITHLFVWVETLSFSIKDSMCGFRVYPLSQTLPLLDKYKVGSYMDFDTEIIVKLSWGKVDVISVPTTVVYPKGGLSNFRPWKDNWLISRMHFRLLLGMMMRLPVLIHRKIRREDQRHWAKIAEKGTALGLAVMFWAYRLLGRRFMLLLLHPVILYYFLTAGKARLASVQYQEQLALQMGQKPEIGWKKIYSHFYAFGVSAVDKLASWSGQINRSDIIIHGKENFEEILSSGKGAIFIGSHLGNLELCRALGEKGGRFRINAIVFNRNSLRFQEVLRRNAPEVALNQIHVESIGVDTAILLKQKADSGEIIIIVGDRIPVKSTGRIHYVNFLGRQAPFAEGPFILASLLECPVYLIFCILESNTYNVYLELFSGAFKYPRSERSLKLTADIQKYAKRLAYFCTKSPLQWFNFYNFWYTESSGNSAPKGCADSGVNRTCHLAGEVPGSEAASNE